MSSDVPQSEKLSFLVDIDGTHVYEIQESISQDSLTQSAAAIEQSLSKQGTDPVRIQNIYELTVETLQNILSYSYGSRYEGGSQKTAEGSFRVTYESKTDTYHIDSSNLIQAQQEAGILNRVAETRGLDDKELRKRIREKMRSRQDQHKRGAGLGFLTMGRRCSSPIQVDFEDVEMGVKRFILHLEA
jgi:hypothetical protein